MVLPYIPVLSNLWFLVTWAVGLGSFTGVGLLSVQTLVLQFIIHTATININELKQWTGHGERNLPACLRNKRKKATEAPYSRLAFADFPRQTYSFTTRHPLPPSSAPENTFSRETFQQDWLLLQQTPDAQVWSLTWIGRENNQPGLLESSPLLWADLKKKKNGPERGEMKLWKCLFSEGAVSMWHLTHRYRFYFLNCSYKGLIAQATRNTGGPPPTVANPAKFLSGRRKGKKNYPKLCLQGIQCYKKLIHQSAREVSSSPATPIVPNCLVL